MQRFVLGLPVFLLALPLLVYLLLSAPPSGGETTIGDLPPIKLSTPDVRPDEAQMERLAKDNSVAFLEYCLHRYYDEVHGYHLIMQKQERLGRTLHPKEVIEVFFKEKPHSVCLIWREGARKAERALFVEGENNGMMLARPNGAILRRLGGDIVDRKVNGDEAKQSGRFTLDQYGIKKATERYLAAWKAARDQGKLDIKYLGVHRLPEANNQLCYHFHRKCAEPENDGVMEQTLYIDKATWLQVGSVIKGKDDQLIGEYYFRDIQLNPEFKPNQFKPEALKP